MSELAANIPKLVTAVQTMKGRLRLNIEPFQRTTTKEENATYKKETATVPADVNLYFSTTEFVDAAKRLNAINGISCKDKDGGKTLELTFACWQEADELKVAVAEVMALLVWFRLHLRSRNQNFLIGASAEDIAVLRFMQTPLSKSNQGRPTGKEVLQRF